MSTNTEVKNGGGNHPGKVCDVVSGGVLGSKWDGTSVDICICTFRRPELLSATLASIASCDLPKGVVVRVIVVDNDSVGSARYVVHEFGGAVSWPVLYEIESRQNIAHARNACVRLAVARLVAFLDDDEIVDRGWLTALLNCMAEFGADAVFGPVLPVYPEGTPAWVRSSGIVDRRRYPTGTGVRTGATGNVLVKREVLIASPGPFNPAFGLTGGEDADLFSRAAKKGYRLVWCDEAVVLENISLERATFRFVVLRAYRSGQSWARIFLSDASLGAMGIWLLKRVVLTLTASVLVVALLPLGVKPRVWSLRKLFLNLGQLSALAGGRIEEYAGKPRAALGIRELDND